ncbi:MAG TPA: phosphatase PAP2-related protein [Candidatus Paceibacterota bacterium]|nr:phosphatase PAP2-related protein [Candidatus Paceibacterota bacterium]
MLALFKEHKGFWTPARKHSMRFGFLLLVLSVIIQIVLGRFSSRVGVDAPGVRDIFLDNLPLVNLSAVIVGGAIVLWIFAWVLLIVHPRYLIFSTKAIALYIVSRAFFFSLTHVGPYPLNYSPSSHNDGYGLYHLVTFQNNFFYSGHTAFPFLLALIFWENKFLRYLFLFLTVFFGASVLLAHVHYSIDVFAAPFIVYGMFVMTAKLFPRDYALFTS